MKRVAFVVGEMCRGGAERVVSVLANHFAQDGYAVDILTLFSTKVEYNIDERINIIDCKSTTPANYYSSAPHWFREIRRYTKTERPDAIFALITRIGVLTVLATMGMGVQVVVSERNDPHYDHRSLFMRLMTNMAFRRAHKIVFQTKRVQSYYNMSIQRNSVIIPNPINVTDTAEGPFLPKIVSVGRLQPQKNHKMLIAAFAEVLKRHPNYSLVIYGEGPLRSELETLIKDKGLTHAVQLPGNVNNVHTCIRDAEMFVLPSDYEGLSNALLEAMAIGLPCISTNCAGSDEVIEDGINGLITPVGDQERLTAAIDRLITSKELQEYLRRNALETAKQFNSITVYNQWKNLIEN